MASSGFQCYSELDLLDQWGSRRMDLLLGFLNEATENHDKNTYRDVNCGFSWPGFCCSAEHSLGKVLGGPQWDSRCDTDRLFLK